MTMTGTKSVNCLVFSNDLELENKPETPKPTICEFCGERRYTQGIMIGKRIFWRPSGAESCSCPQARVEHERKEAESAAKMAAKEQAEKDEQMRKKVQRVIGNSGMREHFLQCTFESYESDTNERKKIYNLALNYARNFESKLPKRGEPLPGRNGFLISGTKGTGKTHIAAAIANYLLNQGTSVICMTERNLFGKIQDTYASNRGYSDGQTETQIRQVYETVPLLIINDLGKEKASEWTLATLYAIIDGRYERAMPTIITTNYDAESLTKRITPMGGDIITAEAIVDRLCEMCESIVITGESWRLK